MHSGVQRLECPLDSVPQAGRCAEQADHVCDRSSQKLDKREAAAAVPFHRKRGIKTNHLKALSASHA